MTLTLPCLSLRQPWGWLVVNGHKPIENRTWSTRLRGTVLLHASKGMTNEEWSSAATFAETAGFHLILPRSVDRLQRGGIIGAARIVDVRAPREADDGWHMAGQHGFVLERATVLPFRPYRGALGFFKVEVTPAERDALARAGLFDGERRVG